MYECKHKEGCTCRLYRLARIETIIEDEEGFLDEVEKSTNLSAWCKKCKHPAVWKPEE
jgi:hypothetical protein